MPFNLAAAYAIAVAFISFIVSVGLRNGYSVARREPQDNWFTSLSLCSKNLRDMHSAVESKSAVKLKTLRTR
jgi:hypothetical protein